MHLPQVLLFACAGTSLALAAPRNVLNIKPDDDFALAQRNAETANIMLIQDQIAKTGYDLESDDEKNITARELAKLSANDAQLLAAELNTYSTRNNQTELLIPAFSDQQFAAAAAQLVHVRSESQIEERQVIEALFSGFIFAIIGFISSCHQTHCLHKHHHKPHHPPS
ncbi:hypothetical protein M409DRAFT_57313 [Zasmidium cellare ATCC 36951]|uniref:Uncharacterized protein n=1 Tax=Zasmidium cellare ATCC 36951 TaxID=1080233 RepID=A0A6A6C8D0_ZASCE|nr:uncharacterized protein M409DRAFT_57313 [Zasmidium cellare ATCC 36951]KAF2163404.1 hypothetical protein M409DRAFT_57313 [Zasmidium cellare ATCC 36951]